MSNPLSYYHFTLPKIRGVGAVKIKTRNKLETHDACKTPWIITFPNQVRFSPLKTRDAIFTKLLLRWSAGRKRGAETRPIFLSSPSRLENKRHGCNRVQRCSGSLNGVGSQVLLRVACPRVYRCSIYTSRPTSRYSNVRKMGRREGSKEKYIGETKRFCS